MTPKKMRTIMYLVAIAMSAVLAPACYWVGYYAGVSFCLIFASILGGFIYLDSRERVRK